MSRLPHIVWDMGGIMYEYFTEPMLDIGAERGWPIDSVPLGPTGRVYDPDYDRLLDGSLDEPDYLPIIQARLAEHGIAFDPPVDLKDVHLERKVTWDAVARLHDAGHRQAVLTNDATRWLGESWWETWGFRQFFDAVIDVKTVGVRKPKPEPYLAAIEALAVDASDCLFVDDLPVNCAGAEAVGMESHLFRIVDPEGSIEALLERVELG